MDKIQRSRQMQAIHATYARMIKDGALPPLHAQTGESCHLWATQTLGRLIPSLSCCSDFELNILRDRLNGKVHKIWDKVLFVAEAAGIRDLNAWVARVAQSEHNAWLRGCDPEKLPVSKQWRLLKMLETRSHAHTGPFRKRAAPVRVNEEQRVLWGD